MVLFSIKIMVVFFFDFIKILFLQFVKCFYMYCLSFDFKLLFLLVRYLEELVIFYCYLVQGLVEVFVGFSLFKGIFYRKFVRNIFVQCVFYEIFYLVLRRKVKVFYFLE